MEWLNLHISVLDSASFLGAEPVDRATWLCLLRYCIGQENNGRILECDKWGDRKWQQLCRVTLAEVKRPSELWYWEEFNLVVNFYPSAKEAQVRASRTNGALGGRPMGALDRDPAASVEKPSQEPGQEPSDNRVVPSGENGREVEGKGITGKEGKGREPARADGKGQPDRGELATALPPDASHGSASLIAQLLASWGDRNAKVIDVLRYHKVAFDVRGERLEDEWREVTRDQTPQEVGAILFWMRRGSVRLPSQYRKARQSAEQILKATA